jgi:4-alpha-glucanotransferase
MTRTIRTGRTAGLLVPLFSMPSSESWGIGEILDVIPMARWLRDAGLGVLQLLPINEMAAGQTSPYSAISAMAIDPIFVSVYAAHDFAAAGGERGLDLADQVALRSVRAATRIDHAAVRLVKEHALRRAFGQFWDVDWIRGTARAGSFATFCAWEEWWLADYALYRALRDRFEGRPWTDWDEPLRARHPDALDDARRDLEAEVLFHQYVQWVADEQWETTREASAPVALFGDFPFMVDTDSADVWAHQDFFRLDASVGVPPDAFSATGQDWGMPVYRWDVMEARDHRWLRDRARRTARLFDGYRIDHVVGFYRTYSRPHGVQEGAFEPQEEAAQLAQGERLMRIFLDAGARVVAEDLGSVPDFVRDSLTRLGIAGYKVFRWERAWDQPGQPFRDPAAYPELAVVTTGTHDTDTLATWWDAASLDERRAILALPALRHVVPADASDPAAIPFTQALRDAMLEMLFASPAELAVLPIQDVFGWPDRINVPATVSADNWTWKLPVAVDQLAALPDWEERTQALRDLAIASGRLAQDENEVGRLDLHRT